MKRNVAIALAILTSTMGSELAALAQKWIPGGVEPPQREALWPPRIDPMGVRATLLRWGRSTGEVERIMEAPQQVASYGSEGRNVRVLKKPAEPIESTVT